MPAPISTDLRIRIVEARAQEGLTYEEFADRFHVGRATVDRVLRLARETGSVEPAPHAGGPSSAAGSSSTARDPPRCLTDLADISYGEDKPTRC
jgi:transposase